MQWHPIFAHLLRPLVQEFYDVQTNMAVGDAPRESDIVLVRRTAKRWALSRRVAAPDHLERA